MNLNNKLLPATQRKVQAHNIPVVIKFEKLIPVGVANFKHVLQSGRRNCDILIVNIDVVEMRFCFKDLLCRAYNIHTLTLDETLQ